MRKTSHDKLSAQRRKRQSSMKKIAATIHQPMGIAKIAAGMANPVRDRLDYMRVMRKHVVVQYVPSGTELWYDQDLNAGMFIEGVVVGPESSTLHWELHRERVRLYPVELVSRARIHRREIYLSRYDVVLRARDRITEGFYVKEDSFILGAFDLASTGFNAEITITTRLNKLTLARAVAALRRVRLPISAYLFPPDAQIGLMTLNFQELDQAGMEEVRKNGYLGSFYGVDLYHTDLIPRENGVAATDNALGYCVTTPEMLAWMPIYKDFDVEPDDRVSELQIGWIGYMLFGFTLFNNRGLQRMRYRAEGV